MQFWFYLFEVYIYWVVLENAGPTLCDTVDPRKTITADFSQCNTRKFRQNAGKQCVAMLLMWYDHRQIFQRYFLAGVRHRFNRIFSLS